MSITCVICCENVNKSTRKEIECMYCQFKSCRTCCETYILGESTVKCMNGECGKEWTRKFIRESFSTTFVNDKLKKHRENVIFDRERALLPATQPFAESQKRINDIDKETAKIDRAVREMKQQIRDLTNIKYELMRSKVRLQRHPENPQAAEAEAAQATDTEEERQRKQFIKPCPVDDCRGFLSSQWKCGMCSTWCCPDCHIIIGDTKDAPHTCDPNNVESAKLLKAETKPCPQCAASIYKIDGCDQMWCTQCHTAFSWKTGAIETTIHNPHYYEWLRKTQGSVPRNPLDRPHHGCGEIQVGRDMIYLFRQAFRKFTITATRTSMINNTVSMSPENCSLTVMNMIQYITHLQQVEITEFNYELKNRELRVQYLLKNIEEPKFKTLLQQAEKKHNKQREIQDVYIMVSTVAGDILVRFLRYLQDSQNYDTAIIDEMPPLLQYANECLMDIKRTYSCTTMKIFNGEIKLVSAK